MKALFVLMALASALSVAEPAKAQGYRIDVKDDPFRPHLQYEGEANSVSADPDTTRIFVLTGIVDRKTRSRKYVLQWGVVYRDREWRRFTSARLEGGDALEFTPSRRDVSSCVAAYRTCIYEEFYLVFFTEAQIKRGAKEGLTFKTFTQSSKDIVTTIPAALIVSLLGAMAAGS